MGREIRRVPLDWEHPRVTEERRPSYNHRIGDYMPMHKELYKDAAQEWLDNAIAWSKKEHEDQQDGERSEYQFYWEWSGDPPDSNYYRHREWTEEEAVGYQMYENVSEGTPVSPVFATAEELEDWLVDTQGHSRGAAKNFVETGWAPSMVMMGGRIASGIDAHDLLTPCEGDE